MASGSLRAGQVVVATQQDSADASIRTATALRVRQPRDLSDGVLRPYQRRPPAVVLEGEDEAVAPEPSERR